MGHKTAGSNYFACLQITLEFRVHALGPKATRFPVSMLSGKERQHSSANCFLSADKFSVSP